MFETDKCSIDKLLIQYVTAYGRIQDFINTNNLKCIIILDVEEYVNMYISILLVYSCVAYINIQQSY